MPTSHSNRLLGFPPDARLLILNADDFGMYPAINAGVLQALTIDPGWPVQRADFEFMVSAEASELIDQEGIVLLDYRPLQAVWRKLPA